MSDKTDHKTDDSRLSTTEQQMRRALGLGDGDVEAPSPSADTGSRRFAREADALPVTIVHRNHDGGVNKLDAARRALQEQITLRERDQQQLRDARAQLHELQTKLGHAEIAHEEAARRFEQQMRSLRGELEAEHVLRLKAEAELERVVSVRKRPAHNSQPPKTDRRRGRPPKVTQVEQESVEWWVPGWQERLPHC
jgi:septal ring factor EnvC (AmiA/AmiB activator)